MTTRPVTILTPEEKETLHTVVACYGTEAKDSDVLEVTENASLDPQQSRRVLAAYNKISTRLFEWLREELEDY